MNMQQTTIGSQAVIVKDNLITGILIGLASMYLFHLLVIRDYDAILMKLKPNLQECLDKVAQQQYRIDEETE